MSQQSHSWVRSLQERFARPRSRQRWSRQPNVIDTRTGERAWCTLAGTHRSAFGGSGTGRALRTSRWGKGAGLRNTASPEPLRSTQSNPTRRDGEGEPGAGARGRGAGTVFSETVRFGETKARPGGGGGRATRDVLRAAERALRTARHLSCRVCFNTTKRSNLLDQKTC